ncbi:MAG: DUF3179 domain-containing (seleno)protein [Phycisphaerales bacterium]
MTTANGRILTFRGGGWVLVVAALLCAALLAWALLGVFSGHRPQGDGKDPATYGFDLSNLRIDGHALVGSGNSRGFLPPLDNPATLAADDVAPTNQSERVKHVVGGDRVMGVVIGGEARAYPLPIMNAHEVCNDTLGGVPIAVTYSPLCDSVVVFDRRIGAGAAARPPDAPSTPSPQHIARFAATGLLLDSNLVMEDLDEPGTLLDGVRGLWSQLGARAISGPAARDDATLRIVPDVQLVTWSLWRARHPQTTVIRRDPESIRRMKQIDYSRYFDGGKLLFPVQGRFGAPGSAPPTGSPTMMPVTVVTIDGERHGYRTDDLFARNSKVSGGLVMEANGVAQRQINAVTIAFELDRPTDTVWVDAPPETVILHMRWFAWWAFFEPPPTGNE